MIPGSLFKVSKIRLVTLVAALAVSGCAATPRHLPGMVQGPTESQREGEFVFFDLLSPDPAEAEKFYGELFGWQFGASRRQDYRTIENHGHTIAGLFLHEPDPDEETDVLWIPSLSVADVDAITRRATDAGGKVLLGPIDAGKRGRIALLSDPEGAEFTVVRSQSGDPQARPTGSGDFSWVQLWSRDPRATAGFYRKVAGLDVGRIQTHDNGIDEGIFSAAGREVAGLIELPWAGVRPHWLAWIRVGDIEATLAQAQELGGRTLVRGARLAIVQDPQGGVFGIDLQAGEKGANR